MVGLASCIVLITLHFTFLCHMFSVDISKLLLLILGVCTTIYIFLELLTRASPLGTVMGSKGSDKFE